MKRRKPELLRASRSAEVELQEVVKNQQIIRTKRLGNLLKPLRAQMRWYEKKLKENTASMNKLNQRAQEAERGLEDAKIRIHRLTSDLQSRGGGGGKDSTED